MILSESKFSVSPDSASNDAVWTRTIGLTIAQMAKTLALNVTLYFSIGQTIGLHELQMFSWGTL